MSHQESATSDISRSGVNHSQGKLRGDRCIDGVASFLQHSYTGLARQGMRSDYRTMSEFFIFFYCIVIGVDTGTMQKMSGGFATGPNNQEGSPKKQLG
jgi:hypothetical protein